MTLFKLLLFSADAGSAPCNPNAGEIPLTWQSFSTFSWTNIAELWFFNERDFLEPCFSVRSIQDRGTSLCLISSLLKHTSSQRSYQTSQLPSPHPPLMRRRGGEKRVNMWWGLMNWKTQWEKVCEKFYIRNFQKGVQYILEMGRLFVQIYLRTTYLTFWCITVLNLTTISLAKKFLN